MTTPYRIQFSVDIKPAYQWSPGARHRFNSDPSKVVRELETAMRDAGHIFTLFHPTVFDGTVTDD